MLRVITFLAKVGIRDQTEIESLISHLRSKGYPAMIRSMFTGMFNLVKLPEPDEQVIAKMIPSRLMREPSFLGDLFITDDIVYILNPVETKMLLRLRPSGMRDKNNLCRSFARISKKVSQPNLMVEE